MTVVKYAGLLAVFSPELIKSNCTVRTVIKLINKIIVFTQICIKQFDGDSTT